MKKYIILLASLISLFILLTTISLTISEDEPWIVYGYVYLDNEIIIPDEVTLIISNQEYQARIYENGYYLIEFSPQETGITGTFTLATASNTWEIEAAMTIENQAYIFNQDIYLSTNRQPPNPPEINGETQGTIDTEYTYTFKTIDPDNDNIKYSLLWDDFTEIAITELLPSGTEYIAKHTWTKPGIYVIQANAKDENNQISETTELTVLIDTHYVGYLGYLIDDNSDGAYDTFYSNTIEMTTDVLQKNEGYVIDTDRDYIWDYEYNPDTYELVQINQEQTNNKQDNVQKSSSENQWLIIFAFIFFSGAIVVLIIAFYLKNQKTSIKENIGNDQIKPIYTKVEKPIFEPRQIEVKNVSQRIDHLIASQTVKEEKEPQLPDLKEIRQHIDQLRKRNGSAGI